MMSRWLKARKQIAQAIQNRGEAQQERAAAMFAPGKKRKNSKALSRDAALEAAKARTKRFVKMTETA